MIRQKNSNQWQLTLFDAYVKSSNATISENSSGLEVDSRSSQDFIVPIVKVTLDGQSLFTEENNDKVYPTKHSGVPTQAMSAPRG